MLARANQICDMPSARTDHIISKAEVGEEAVCLALAAAVLVRSRWWPSRQGWAAAKR
jgi:hypothetical protein